MNGKTGDQGGGGAAKDARDARLKAALRANLGRRKAQMRGRAADSGGQPSNQLPDDSTDFPNDTE